MSDHKSKYQASLFSTFVVGLAYTARMHLGEAPHLESGDNETNRPLARQVIEQIEMLEEKTKGNLSEQEAELLSDLLYDLRLRYARKA